MPTALASASGSERPLPVGRSATVKLWMRQDGETVQAYEAFCLYRDMGVDRSYLKVAQKLTKSETLIHRWGTRWLWQKRISAYLHDLDADTLRQQKQDILAMNARHRKIALAFQEKLARRLADLNPEELTPQDLAKWATIAVEMERDSYGLSKLLKLDQTEEVQGVLQSQELAAFDERLSSLSSEDRTLIRQLSIKYLRTIHSEFSSQGSDAIPAERIPES
jgi:hypothetical protein